MVVLPSLETGGTERQLVLLAHGLVKLDPTWLHRMQIVVMRGGGSLEAELPAGTNVVSLAVSNFYDPRALPRLRRAIRSWKPDVVYSLLAPANVASALSSLRLDTRLVWGHRSQTLSSGHGDLRRWFTTTLLRALSSQVDLVIVNSDRARTFITTIGSLATRTAIIPNAVDSRRFRLPAATPAADRRALGLPDDARIVLTVGRLADDKDHATLFNAFKQLVKSRSDARLVVVGGGSKVEEERVRVAAHDLGDLVTFAGPREDVERYFNAADVLVVSSKGEGSSNVITEALLCGCPCVSTDTGTAREVLGDAVVPVGDFHSLAVAIDRVLATPRHAALAPVVAFTDLDLAQATLEALGP